jgi:hypothetical protein
MAPKKVQLTWVDCPTRPAIVETSNRPLFAKQSGKTAGLKDLCFKLKQGSTCCPSPRHCLPTIRLPTEIKKERYTRELSSETMIHLLLQTTAVLCRVVYPQRQWHSQWHLLDWNSLPLCVLIRSTRTASIYCCSLGLSDPSTCSHPR